MATTCSGNNAYYTDDNVNFYLDDVPVAVTDFNVTESVTTEEVSNTIDPGKQEAVNDEDITVTFNVFIRTDGGGNPIIHEIKAGNCYNMKAYLREPDYGYIGDILIDSIDFPVEVTRKVVRRAVTGTLQGGWTGPNLS